MLGGVRRRLFASLPKDPRARGGCYVLVQQQQARRPDQAGAEVELAAHAARVGPHQSVGVLDQAQLGEHTGAVGTGRGTTLPE